MHDSSITSNEMLAEVKRFERKLGYRLVIKSFISDKTLSSNSKYNVEIEWENTGVAPPYWNYNIFYMFENNNTDTYIINTDESIKGWLPGVIKISQSIKLPNGMVPGNYVVYIGLTNPSTKEASIQLAIDCERICNWYKMGSITTKD